MPQRPGHYNPFLEIIEEEQKKAGTQVRSRENPFLQIIEDAQGGPTPDEPEVSAIPAVASQPGVFDRAVGLGGRALGVVSEAARSLPDPSAVSQGPIRIGGLGSSVPGPRSGGLPSPAQGTLSGLPAVPTPTPQQPQQRQRRPGIVDPMLNFRGRQTEEQAAPGTEPGAALPPLQIPGRSGIGLVAGPIGGLPPMPDPNSIAQPSDWLGQIGGPWGPSVGLDAPEPPEQRRARLQEEGFWRGQEAKATTGDKIRHGIGAYGRGLGSMAGAVPKSIALASHLLGEDRPTTDLATYRLGELIEEGIASVLPAEDPRLARSFTADVLPQAAGSMTGFAAGGIAGGAAKLNQLAVIATTGAAVQAVEQYEDALAHGADEATAHKAAIIGVPLGLTEALPFSRWLKALSKAGKAVGGIRSLMEGAVLGAGEEAIQEGGQQVGGNITAQMLYDPDRQTLEGVGVGAGAGGILGGLMGFGAALLGARRRGAGGPGVQQADVAGNLPARELSPEEREDRMSQMQALGATLPTGAQRADETQVTGRPPLRARAVEASAEANLGIPTTAERETAAILDRAVADRIYQVGVQRLNESVAKERSSPTGKGIEGLIRPLGIFERGYVKKIQKIEPDKEGPAEGIREREFGKSTKRLLDVARYYEDLGHAVEIVRLKSGRHLFRVTADAPNPARQSPAAGEYAPRIIEEAPSVAAEATEPVQRPERREIPQGPTVAPRATREVGPATNDPQAILEALDQYLAVFQPKGAERERLGRERQALVSAIEQGVSYAEGEVEEAGRVPTVGEQPVVRPAAEEAQVGAAQREGEGAEGAEEEVAPGKEKIITAAIRSPSGKVYRGQTHGHAVQAAQAAGDLPAGTFDHYGLQDAGWHFDLFETNRGRLVDRFQADQEFGVTASENIGGRDKPKEKPDVTGPAATEETEGEVGPVAPGPQAGTTPSAAEAPQAPLKPGDKYTTPEGRTGTVYKSLGPRLRVKFPDGTTEAIKRSYFRRFAEGKLEPAKDAKPVSFDDIEGLEGIEFFSARMPGDLREYYVSEASTGMPITSLRDTRKEAIEAARTKMTQMGSKIVKEAIAEKLARYGPLPKRRGDQESKPPTHKAGELIPKAEREPVEVGRFTVMPWVDLFNPKNPKSYREWTVGRWGDGAWTGKRTATKAEAVKQAEEWEAKEVARDAEDAKARPDAQARKDAAAKAAREIREAEEAERLEWKTGTAENDARLKKYRAMKRSGQPMGATQEHALALYEGQAKADPAKWGIGEGVGYRVYSGGKSAQVNRGFRIADVRPGTKQALLKQVADTGITVTGGTGAIGDQWVHVADLVRDRKYDAPRGLETPVISEAVPQAELPTAKKPIRFEQADGPTLEAYREGSDIFFRNADAEEGKSGSEWNKATPGKPLFEKLATAIRGEQPAQSEPATTETLQQQYAAILKKRLAGTGFENDPQSPVYRAASQDALQKLKKVTGRPDIDFGTLKGYGPKVAPVEKPAPTAAKPEPPVIQGKPVRTEEKEAAELPIATASDIPLETARLAHQGTSHVPEKRGDQERSDYVATYESAVKALEPLAKSPEQRAVLVAELKRYKDGLRQRFLAKLQAQSRVMSSMITGPANFPVERNRKRGDTADKRRRELIDFDKKAVASIKKKLGLAATPEQLASEGADRLKRQATELIATMRGIESGELAGSDPALFKSSFIGKLNRSGDIDAIRAALDTLREGQRGLKGPVFTERHSVWKLAEKAEEAREASREPTRSDVELVAEYDGAKIVRNFGEDRVQIEFDEKPGEKVRTAMKSEGWRWSPSNEAWQRKNTLNAVASAKAIVGQHYQAAPETPAPIKTPAEKPAKEPWQQTPEEYIAGITDVDAIAVKKAAHPKQVRAAVERGDPVPRENLVAYRHNQWAKDALAAHDAKAQEIPSEKPTESKTTEEPVAGKTKTEAPTEAEPKRPAVGGVGRTAEPTLLGKAHEGELTPEAKAFIEAGEAAKRAELRRLRREAAETLGRWLEEKDVNRRPSNPEADAALITLGRVLRRKGEYDDLLAKVNAAFREGTEAIKIDKTTTLYVPKDAGTVLVGRKKLTRAKAVETLTKIKPQKTWPPKPKKQKKPPKPKPPKRVTTDEEAVESLGAAAAREVTRFAITGVAVLPEGYAVSTDVRRVHILKLPEGHAIKPGLYPFPEKKPSNEPVGTKEEEGEPRKLDWGNGVPYTGTETGGLYEFGKGEDALHFPNYKGVLPPKEGRETPDHGVYELDIVKHLGMIRRAALLTSVESKGITVAANTNGTIGYGASTPDVGQAEIGLDIGAQVKVGLNPDFLIDALEFIYKNSGPVPKGKPVMALLQITDYAKPVRIDGKNTTAVIMPISLEGGDKLTTQRRIDIGTDPALSLKVRIEDAEIEVRSVEKELDSVRKARDELDARIEKEKHPEYLERMRHEKVIKVAELERKLTDAEKRLEGLREMQGPAPAARKQKGSPGASGEASVMARPIDTKEARDVRDSVVAGEAHPMEAPPARPVMESPREGFVVALMEAARRLAAPARYKRMKGLMLGIFRSKVGPPRIELGDIRWVRTFAHELGHAVDYRLNGDRFLPTILKRFPDLKISEKDARAELKRVSEVMRPLGTSQWTDKTNHIKYRSRGQELMADLFSMYCMNPKMAHDLAPNVTKALENAIAVNGDIRAALQGVLNPDAPPLPSAEQVLKVARKLPFPAQPPTAFDSTQPNPELRKEGYELATKLKRWNAAQLHRIDSLARRWVASIPKESDRETIGAFVEKSGVVKIVNDTFEKVLARMTPKMHKVAEHYRYEVELLRQELNKMLEEHGTKEFLSYIDDYLAHFYTKDSIGKLGRKGVAEVYTRWRKTTPHSKQRTYKTFDEAFRKAGLVPVSQDFAYIFQRAAANNINAATGLRLLGEMKQISKSWEDAGGRPLLEPDFSKRPSDYVEFHHPLLRRVYARKTKDGSVILGEGAVWVHPDWARPLKTLLDKPFSGMAFKFFHAIASHGKAINVGASGFHEHALFESSFGALMRWWNPVRGFAIGPFESRRRGLGFRPHWTHRAGLLLDAKKPDVTGNLIGAGLGMSRAAMTDYARHDFEGLLRGAENWLRSGKIGPIRTSAFTGRTPAPWILNIARRVYGNYNYHLWDNVHTGLKLFTAHTNAEYFAKNLPKNMSTKFMLETVADYTNNMFGGQEWLKLPVWHKGVGPLSKHIGRIDWEPLTVKQKQLAHLVMFAPDWFVTNVKIAGKSLQDILQWNKNPVARKLALRYWINMPIALTVEAAIVQRIIYEVWGDDDDGDKPWPWENELGREHDFDITPLTRTIARNLGTQLPRGRVYAHNGKQVREVMRYFDDFPKGLLQSMGSKASVPIRLVYEQFSGRSIGSDYPMPWTETAYRDGLEGWDQASARWQELREQFYPFSWSDTNFAFSLPKRRGMSRYRAMRYFKDAMEIIVDPDESQKRKDGASKIMGDVLDALKRNNVDTDRAKKTIASAKAKVTANHRKRFMDAMEDQDFDEADKQARILNAITPGGRFKSDWVVERAKGRNWTREEAKTALELIAK